MMSSMIFLVALVLPISAQQVIDLGSSSGHIAEVGKSRRVLQTAGSSVFTSTVLGGTGTNAVAVQYSTGQLKALVYPFVLSMDEASMWAVVGASNVLLKVDVATSGSLLQVGTGASGAVDGVAASAQFNSPAAIGKQHGSSLMYVVENGQANQPVRTVDEAGTVDTVPSTIGQSWARLDGVTLSPDGQTMFLASRDSDRGSPEATLFKLVYSDGAWGTPTVFKTTDDVGGLAALAYTPDGYSLLAGAYASNTALKIFNPDSGALRESVDLGNSGDLSCIHTGPRATGNIFIVDTTSGVTVIGGVFLSYAPTPAPPMAPPSPPPPATPPLVAWVDIARSNNCVDGSCQKPGGATLTISCLSATPSAGSVFPTSAVVGGTFAIQLINVPTHCAGLTSGQPCAAKAGFQCILGSQPPSPLMSAMVDEQRASKGELIALGKVIQCPLGNVAGNFSVSVTFDSVPIPFDAGATSSVTVLAA